MGQGAERVVVMAEVDRLGNILEMDSQSEKVTTAQTAEVKDKKVEKLNDRHKLWCLIKQQWLSRTSPQWLRNKTLVHK